MKRILSIIILISFYPLYCSAQSTLQKADSLFYLHKQENGPGISITVSKNGKTLYQNQMGYANLEHQIPITRSSRFLVGSISKQFTAFSILLLAEQNKLSIEDPIIKYLPELKDLNQKITIRMLANHTNGFRNNTDLNGLRGKSTEDLIYQKEMVTLLLRQRGLNFEPGEKFQYNNAGYVLLSEIVSRVSGMSFSQFVEENIFAPLQMEDSQFLENPTELITKKVNSYYKSNNKYYYHPMNRAIVGSTGLYTTSGDLIKWAQNFNNPKIGNPDIFAKMTAPSLLNSGQKIPYGLGVETKIYKGVKVIFHGGGDASFRAYLLQVPKFNFIVAVTGNYETFNPLDIAYGMIDIFLEKHLSKNTKSVPPKITTKQLIKYKGTYQVFPGLYINIFPKNDSLFLQPLNTNDKLFLPPISTNEFTFTPSQHSKIVFINDKLIWHFSDFSYPAEKVVITPPVYNQIRIVDYLGEYYSEELQTGYSFVKEGEKIVAKHAFNADIELIPIQKDVFITHSSILSRVHFERDSKNTIIACKISGQTSYNITFKKHSL